MHSNSAVGGGCHHRSISSALAGRNIEVSMDTEPLPANSDGLPAHYGFLVKVDANGANHHSGPPFFLLPIKQYTNLIKTPAVVCLLR